MKRQLSKKNTADRQAKRERMMNFMTSVNTPSVKDATKPAPQVTPIPLCIFSRHETKKKTGHMVNGRFIVPTAFNDYPVDPTGYDEDGKAYVKVNRDARTPDKKRKDNDQLKDYPEHDATKLQDMDDPEQTYVNTYIQYTEGRHYDFYDTSDYDMGPGSVVIAMVETRMWHDKDDFKFHCMSKINRIERHAKIPQSMLRDWLVAQNMLSKHFKTGFPIAIETGESVKRSSDVFLIRTGHSIEDMDPTENPSSCLYYDETPATEKEKFQTFSKEQNKAFEGITKMMVGFQWDGEHSEEEWRDNDWAFTMVLPLYTEYVKDLQISNIDVWQALMPHIHDLMEGIYIGREDYVKGSHATVNDENYGQVDKFLGLEEQIEQVNKPRGPNEYAFALCLQPLAYLYDPVDFIKRVGVPVSAETVKKAFKQARGMVVAHEGNHRVKRKPDFSENPRLLCMNEVDSSKDLSPILKMKDVEFRVLLGMKPASTMKDNFYEEIEQMSAEDGDVLYNFVISGVFRGFGESALKKVPKDHMVHKYQLEKIDNIKYFFAINNAAKQEEQNDLAKLNLGTASNDKFIKNNPNEIDIDEVQNGNNNSDDEEEEEEEEEDEEEEDENQ